MKQLVVVSLQHGSRDIFTHTTRGFILVSNFIGLLKNFFSHILVLSYMTGHQCSLKINV